MISTIFLKTGIRRMLDCVKALAMTFVFVSVALAEAPAGQTEALYFNAGDGNMYLWDGTGVLPGAATTVATAGNFSGSFSWDGIKTLTITNFEYSTTNPYALYIDFPINVELVGDNTLTSTYSGSAESVGLYFKRSSTITGSGTLTVQAGIVDTDMSAGIFSNSGLTVEGGTTNAYGGNGLTSFGIYVFQVLMIDNGVINAHGGDATQTSVGIWADSGLEMNGGMLNADCMDAALFSSGFRSNNGAMEINGGVFVSKGHQGAVYANDGAVPPGSDAIFPVDGYVVWYDSDIEYVPTGSGIHSDDYVYSSGNNYVKFAPFGIDDIAAPVWVEGKAISLTPPTIFSGGTAVADPGWEISVDGNNDWAAWTVPSLASMDLNGLFLRYAATVQGQKYSNVVPITVNQGIVADITDLTVDGISAERDNSNFSVFTSCGRNSVTVDITTNDPDATVEIDGLAQNPLTINLPRYGNNHISITVTSKDGDVQTYWLAINKLIPFEQLVTMRWDNTLSVINNPANNGGYSFNSYRWFRIGDTEPFNTNQWWSAGAKGETLNTVHEYYVEAVTADDNVLRTCANKIRLHGLAVKAYPSPVASGQTLYIEANADEELLKGAVIEVYDTSGNRVDYLKAQGRLTPVNVDYVKGVYIFVLKAAGGLTKELKVLVE